LDWRVDSLLSSNTVEELNVPAVQLKFNLTPLQNTVRSELPAPVTASSPCRLCSPYIIQACTTEASFEVTAEKFSALFSELKAARIMMEGLEA
jgi:hypothetical protein